jgi:hypothetical protein
MIVFILLVWQILLLGMLTLSGREDPQLRALAGMAGGLSLFWIGGCGLISLFGRDSIRQVVQRIPLPLGVTFFVFVTILAMVEEAIATLMTNCAPLFGVRVGEVYITASADYLDVILYHSVIVFLGQFATWAALLSRYAFSPFSVFLLYGLTGFINETLFGGLQPLALAQWILIYGLMIYLPAYCYPQRSGRLAVSWWHYPLAVMLPIAGAVPLVLLMQFVIAPGHPSIHFTPMGKT